MINCYIDINDSIILEKISEMKTGFRLPILDNLLRKPPAFVNEELTFNYNKNESNMTFPFKDLKTTKLVSGKNLK